MTLIKESVGNSTIDYYNQNAQAFYDRTINASLENMYPKFLAYVPKNGLILDAGCGSGRDTKYFLSKGYNVTAFDASEEMVKLSTQTTGQMTHHLRFEDLTYNQAFNAIWANASLLHISYNQTPTIFKSIYKALKPDGVFYASYKYGENKMTVEGREFFNMTETTILPYLQDLFEIIEIWKSDDTRSRVAPSADKSWLNILVKKKD